MTTITIERAVVHRALSALEYHTQQTRPIHNTELVIEELRDALAAPATAPERPNPYDACESFKAYQLSCRREAVLQKEIERLLAAPATAPDRHARELLAQDITIANMRERHAQELCAYQVTVDKLRAERKPMTPKQIYQICPELCNDEAIVEFARRIELHHGIGDKT